MHSHMYRQIRNTHEKRTYVELDMCVFAVPIRPYKQSKQSFGAAFSFKMHLHVVVVLRKFDPNANANE